LSCKHKTHSGWPGMRCPSCGMTYKAFKDSPEGQEWMKERRELGKRQKIEYTKEKDESYVVLSSDSEFKLARKVNFYLSCGYAVVGGVSVSGRPNYTKYRDEYSIEDDYWYTQAVYKKRDEDPQKYVDIMDYWV